VLAGLRKKDLVQATVAAAFMIGITYGTGCQLFLDLIPYL
jgi:hypothetical protein